MTLTRGISLSAHSAIETLAAPVVMVVPFVLGFSPVATAITVALGALLLTIALQVEHPRRTVPLSAHAGFDYVLAVVAVSAGLGFALATGAWAESVFLVGLGVAQAALATFTRFTATRGA